MYALVVALVMVIFNALVGVISGFGGVFDVVFSSILIVVAGTLFGLGVSIAFVVIQFLDWKTLKESLFFVLLILLLPLFGLCFE